MRIWKKILAGLLVGSMSFGMASSIPAEQNHSLVAEAAGAVNILDYESNKTASEYAIYDVEGMEYLAKLGEKISFKGKTIYLENDLVYDKSIENNHIPIYFDGNFDGKNHIIKGINVNRKGEYVGGIFSMVADGNVTRIVLDDSIVTSENCDFGLGGIVGELANSKVSKCKTTKTVKIRIYNDFVTALVVLRDVVFKPAQ